MKGTFYVYKKRMVAQFGYGEGMSYQTELEAYSALDQWMSKRKDAKTIRVEHVKA